MIMKSTAKVLLFIVLFAVPHNFLAASAPEPNIDIKGYSLGKYAIPTTVKIEAPKGVTVGPIAFPRALIRKLKAVNNESLAVYEGRAIMRFNVTVPANYGDGWLNLKARLRYQSCNDDVCFPPKNQDIDFGISIIGANDRVQRANGWVFGGR